MTPEAYDAWYRTPRGGWIGEIEYRLLRQLLAPAEGDSVLDIGCGTGYFTRRFALDGHPATGIDADRSMLAVAHAHRAAAEHYLQADAYALPFNDRQFDYSVAVTSLCFMKEEAAALGEMARVARRGIALGLLNRRSLLYLQKGRHGGVGAYRGAHWHTAHEVRELFWRLGLPEPQLRFAAFLPNGSALSRALEAALPSRWSLGGFLAAAARLP